MEVRVSAAGGEEGPRSPPPQKWRAEEACGRWRTAREEGQGGGRTDGGAAPTAYIDADGKLRIVAKELVVERTNPILFSG